MFVFLDGFHNGRAGLAKILSARNQRISVIKARHAAVLKAHIAFLRVQHALGAGADGSVHKLVLIVAPSVVKAAVLPHDGLEWVVRQTYARLPYLRRIAEINRPFAVHIVSFLSSPSPSRSPGR